MQQPLSQVVGLLVQLRVHVFEHPILSKSKTCSFLTLCLSLGSYWASGSLRTLSPRLAQIRLGLCWAWTGLSMSTPKSL